MKQCNTCNETKDFTEYHKDKKAKDGYAHACKDCCKARANKWYYENKERALETHKNWRENNKERKAATDAAWAKANRDKCNAATKRWADANPEKIKEKNKLWSQANKGKRNATTRKYQAAKLQRTPSWANLDRIEGIYKLAAYLSEEYNVSIHVDHEIPLQGALVSGLHVEDNLQLMYASDNQSKSNSFEVT